MTNEEFKSYFLVKTGSNIHYENGEKVLELDLDKVKDFFNVKQMTLLGVTNVKQ